MNIVERMEKELKEEIQRLTQYKEFDWEQVFLDGGEVDFHDQEIEIKLWYKTYGERYTFLYDYESETGTLHRVDKEGNFIELWSKDKE